MCWPTGGFLAAAATAAAAAAGAAIVGERLSGSVSSLPERKVRFKPTREAISSERRAPIPALAQRSKTGSFLSEVVEPKPRAPGVWLGTAKWRGGARGKRRGGGGKGAQAPGGGLATVVGLRSRDVTRERTRVRRRSSVRGADRGTDKGKRGRKRG